MCLVLGLAPPWLQGGQALPQMAPSGWCRPNREVCDHDDIPGKEKEKEKEKEVGGGGGNTTTVHAADQITSAVSLCQELVV